MSNSRSSSVSRSTTGSAGQSRSSIMGGKQNSPFKFRGDVPGMSGKPLGSRDRIAQKPVTAKKAGFGMGNQKQHVRMLKETKRIFLPPKYENTDDSPDVVLFEPRVEVLDPSNVFITHRSWYDDFDMLMAKYNAYRTPTFVANDRSSIEYKTSPFGEPFKIRLTHNTVECGAIMLDWFQHDIVGLLILIHQSGAFCTFKLTLNHRHIHIDSTEEFLRNFDLFLGTSDSIEDGLNRNVVDGPEVIVHLFHTNFFKPNTIKTMPFHINYDSQLFDCSRVFAKHQTDSSNNIRSNQNSNNNNKSDIKN